MTQVHRTSAVTVFKPKTDSFKAEPNQTETAIFWRLCDGLSQISKKVQPDDKVHRNNVITGHARLLQGRHLKCGGLTCWLPGSILDDQQGW